MASHGTVETTDRGLYAARQLKRIRLAQGLTQRDIIDRLAALDPPVVYASVVSIGAIEKGRQRFPLDRAPAFARVLGVPLSDLLGSDHLYPPEVPRY